MTGHLKGLRNPRLWDFIAVNATDSISRGGWYSSFGGKPFSSEEMEQYVNDTKVKLAPYLSQEKKALEIGCASGLTMFEIAPFVKEYIGTDMAKENLRINQEYIESDGISNIKLINCSADKLKDAVHQKVDIIIINSVCQYFPSMEYFEEVIENCISMINAGGIVYLGDLLDNKKLGEFIDELKVFKTNNPNIDKVKIDRSDELWISRDYFKTITKRFNQIQDVAVSDKTGDIVNELTKYRYDVILEF